MAMRRNTMQKVLVCVAAALLAALAGCNTMAGMGKDLRSLGDAIENKAEKK
jgi:predicted small secreted protein